MDENFTMPVIVEETMEEVADITPSPRDSPQAGGGGAAVHDTEAELQLFVEVRLNPILIRFNPI